MASKIETGHALNITNMGNLINYCEQLGSNYQPTNPAILLANLKAQYNSAKLAVQAAHDAEANLKNIKGLRKTAFEGFKRFTTQLINIALSSNIPDPIKANIRSINDQIQGTRFNTTQTTKKATEKKDNNTTTNNNDNTNTESNTNTENNNLTENGSNNKNITKKENSNISNSHQSYVQVAKNFIRLVTLLKTQVSYAPNEQNFKISNLEIKALELEAVSENAGFAENARSIAIANRNQIMYHPETGIHNLSILVKQYIKGVFGAKSVQDKKTSSFKIKNLDN